MKVPDLRSYLEPLGAAAAFVLAMWQAPWLAAKFAAKDGWSASGLYSGVFSWASIQAGFLFAIYTFIVPKAEPFIKAIASTKHFASLKQYMLRMTYLTLIVAIVAFGLTVINPKPATGGMAAILLAAWLALFVYTFLGFLKVVRSFRKLDRQRR